MNKSEEYYANVLVESLHLKSPEQEKELSPIKICIKEIKGNRIYSRANSQTQL